MKRYMQIIILMIALFSLQSFKPSDTIVFICITGKVYKDVLERYYLGKLDYRTLKLLSH